MVAAFVLIVLIAFVALHLLPRPFTAQLMFPFTNLSSACRAAPLMSTFMMETL